MLRKGDDDTAEPSITKTIESGAFIRTTTRRDGHRKQETKRFKKNDEKVVLGYIGDFEVFAYPYRNPDHVFLGQFPVCTALDINSYRQLLGTMNKIRWFLRGDWQNEPGHRNAANCRRRQCEKSYNYGLNVMRSQNNARKRLK